MEVDGRAAAAPRGDVRHDASSLSMTASSQVPPGGAPPPGEAPPVDGQATPPGQRCIATSVAIARAPKRLIMRPKRLIMSLA